MTKQLLPGLQNQSMKYIFAVLIFAAYSCHQKHEYKVAVYLNDMGHLTNNASVRNLNTFKSATVGKDSLFRLEAATGDKIEVSLPGYNSITVPATKEEKAFGISLDKE